MNFFGDRSLLVRYGSALLLTSLALAVSLALQTFITDAPPLLFLTGVLVSAWQDGIGPSLFATVVSVIALNYFFLGTLYSFTVTPSELLELSVFAAVAILVSKLAADRREAQSRLRATNAMLADANQGLEKRVAERTQMLREANQQLRAEIVERERIQVELEQSNRELEEFAYILSHDLQSPLRSIRSFVDLLADRYQGSYNAEQRELFSFIRSGSERMHQLIRDLLAYARISKESSGEAVAVDCNLILQRAVASLSAAVRENGATITGNALPVVHGHESQLTQLFENLIGNAIKYHGSEPPLVEVSAERDAERWVFTVKDNGVGIAPDQHERIFKVFKRLYTSDELPGTGIGLSICEKIVERHGGCIWVESTPGHGSKFRFTLSPSETSGAS